LNGVHHHHQSPLLPKARGSGRSPPSLFLLLHEDLGIAQLINKHMQSDSSTAITDDERSLAPSEDVSMSPPPSLFTRPAVEVKKQNMLEIRYQMRRI
jgi:hypothetical protein